WISKRSCPLLESAFAAKTPPKPPPRMRTFFLSMRNSRQKRPAGESVAFRRLKKFSFSSVCLRRSLNKFVGCLVPVRGELDTLSASAGSDYRMQAHRIFGASATVVRNVCFESLADIHRVDSHVLFLPETVHRDVII